MLHPVWNALLPYAIVILTFMRFFLMEFYDISCHEFFPLLHENKNNDCISQASVYDLAPLNFRRRVTRPVSYYALF